MVVYFEFEGDRPPAVAYDLRFPSAPLRPPTNQYTVPMTPFYSRRGAAALLTSRSAPQHTLCSSAELPFSSKHSLHYQMTNVQVQSVKGVL